MQPSAVGQTTVWVGLDVHKDTIVVAAADGAEEPRHVGTVANDGNQLAKVLRRLGGQGDIRCAYEAGPCGFDVYRMCQRLGVECLVAAPSLIPRKPGDRVKTDRRDALKLCRCLRNGDLTAVWVPGPGHEALRDLVRAREDAVEDRTRVRHRIKKMLLRQGVRRPDQFRVWSRGYRTWLGQVTFEHLADGVVWLEYLGTLDELEARVLRYNDAIVEQAGACEHSELIASLQILKGIATINAATLVAELGDLARFDRPKQLFSFVGLVPGEYSSGDYRRRGGITKAGNHHVRRALVEAAWAYRYPPSVKGRLAVHAKQSPQWLVDLGWRAQDRLHRRYRALLRANKPNQIAITAVSRELLAFIWEVAREVRGRRLVLAS